MIGGIDQLFYMEPELRRFGIDPRLLAQIMDADESAISKMALFLLEALVERDCRRRNGETHLVRRGKAIPDKLVNWLINCALDGLSWNDRLEIPRDLIVLIRERLGGSNPEYEQASHAHQMRWHAITIGAHLMAQGRTPTFRHIGRVLGVAPSTVKRWFPHGEFSREVGICASWFDENGKPTLLSKLSKVPLREK